MSGDFVQSFDSEIDVIEDSVPQDFYEFDPVPEEPPIPPAPLDGLMELFNWLAYHFAPLFHDGFFAFLIIEP